ncbi:uncharacterized protein LOC113539830 [Pangasianodon hypophthalmus]|uniref:uncharacterized protein LOC113539830 n=1 Tax=Pangasianodon hypophthalmus TaxID=310915 RepID=UPI0023072988|nr:uncharacterized protein LOC113539830 [Pangasianodon hypophthalmus]
MFCGYWNVDFIRLLCFSLMLAGVASESVRPPPTFEIIEKGNYLNFHASAPESESPHCWTYMFWYRKCNEEKVTTTATKDSNWTAKVEYDAACKYHVQLQAKYDTTYCGDVELDSNISKPVYFGQDGDPDLPFKVSMIVIPVIACSCLSIAIVLFRRHKQKLFPKVPSPSHFFNDMFDRNKEMTKSLYVRELYVPDEEVVEEIQQVMNSNQ